MSYEMWGEFMEYNEFKMKKIALWCRFEQIIGQVLSGVGAGRSGTVAPTDSTALVLGNWNRQGVDCSRHSQSPRCGRPVIKQTARPFRSICWRVNCFLGRKGATGAAGHKNSPRNNDTGSISWMNGGPAVGGAARAVRVLQVGLTLGSGGRIASMSVWLRRHRNLADGGAKGISGGGHRLGKTFPDGHFVEILRRMGKRIDRIPRKRYGP